MQWRVSCTGVKNNYREMLPEELVLPETIEGKKVIAIGKRAFSETNVKKVTIPEGVTTLGEAVWQECTNLTELEIPGR